jgi:hypothetical protein
MARRFVRFTFAAFAVLAIPSLPAAAQSVEEFYKGRTVTPIISFRFGWPQRHRGPPGCTPLVTHMVEQHFIARAIPIEELFVSLAGVNSM